MSMVNKNSKEFKVGDVVRIRRWEDMEKEFPKKTFCGSIQLTDDCFTTEMKRICGAVATIDSTPSHHDSLNLKFFGNVTCGAHITSEMVEHIDVDNGFAVQCTKTMDDRFIVGKVYYSDDGKILDEYGYSGASGGTFRSWYSVYNWKDYDFIEVKIKHEEEKAVKTCKFKVGDKVVAKKDTPYSITTGGWTGTVKEVYTQYFYGGDDIRVSDGSTSVGWSVQSQYFDLVVSDKKVVIIADGNVTRATVYSGDAKENTAQTHKMDDDTYDFAIGSVVSNCRACGVSEQKIKKIYSILSEKDECKYKVGDVVVVTGHSDFYHSFNIGDIIEVIEVCDITYNCKKIDGSKTQYMHSCNIRPITTSKCRADVGEYIIITDPCMTDGTYKKGDICRVTGREYGGLYANVCKTGKHTIFISDDEYEVVKLEKK